MKIIISNIVLLGSPILFNVLWPIKLRYMELVPLFYLSFAGFLIFFIISALILPRFRYLSLNSTLPTLPKHSKLWLLSYFGLISSIFICSNIYFLSTDPVPIKFSHYKQLNCVSSLLTFTILSIIEHIPLIRNKIFLIFDAEPSIHEFLVSPFVYFIISEFIGLVLIFYFIIIESFFGTLLWVVKTYPYIFICLSIVGLILITVGLVLFKVLRHKIKN